MYCGDNVDSVLKILSDAKLMFTTKLVLPANMDINNNIMLLCGLVWILWTNIDSVAAILEIQDGCPIERWYSKMLCIYYYYIK